MCALKTICFAQDIKVMPLLSARAICKQLLRVFCHRRTQQQLLSVVGLFTPPFTSLESVHSGSAAGPGRLYCLTTAIAPVIHLVECR